MDIINIDADKAGKKLEVINRFPFQITTLFFGVAIVYLFLSQKSLEKEFRGYINGDGKVTTEQLIRSTEAIREISPVLESVRIIVLDNNERIRKGDEQ